MDWKAVEVLGYHHYIAQGFNVLVKLVTNSVYDFVVEKDGKFTSVNVKMAGLKNINRPTSWSINLPIHNCNYHPDVYLIYLPHKSTFIEVPSHEFVGFKSKAILIPKQYLKD